MLCLLLTKTFDLKDILQIVSELLRGPDGYDTDIGFAVEAEVAKRRKKDAIFWWFVYWG